MRTFSEVLQALREPFPPEAHRERDLPGGAKWFFIPWQSIRERLDEVCPDWVVEYGMPQYLDKYCIVKCKLTICGVSREALGNAEIELLSKSGKDMSRGTPVERAVADSLKNCAEAFGVAAYLDEQAQDKRDFLVRYLHKAGDGRGYAAARDNNWIGGSLATPEQREQRMKEEQASRRVGNQRPQRARSLPSQQVVVAEPIAPASTNENLEWLRRLTTAMKYSKPHGDNTIKLAMKYEFPDAEKLTSDLDVFERNRVARRILIHYGEKSNPKAESLYQDAIASNEAIGSLEPEELAQAWLTVLTGQTAQVAS